MNIKLLPDEIAEYLEVKKLSTQHKIKLDFSHLPNVSFDGQVYGQLGNGAVLEILNARIKLQTKYNEDCSLLFKATEFYFKTGIKCSLLGSGKDECYSFGRLNLLEAKQVLSKIPSTELHKILFKDTTFYRNYFIYGNVESKYSLDTTGIHYYNNGRAIRFNVETSDLCKACDEYNILHTNIPIDVHDISRGLMSATVYTFKGDHLKYSYGYRTLIDADSIERVINNIKNYEETKTEDITD